MKEAVMLFGSTCLGCLEFSSDLLWRTDFKVPDPVAYFEISGKKIFLLRPLEAERAKKEAKVDEVVSAEPYIKAALQCNQSETNFPVVSFLKDREITHVAVPETLRCGLWRELVENFSVSVKEESFFPERAIKTDREIEEIEKAQRAVENAVDIAREFLASCMIAETINAGIVITGGKDLGLVTAERLRNIIDSELYRQGYLGVESIVSCGEQAADPHCKGRGYLRPFQPIVLDIFPRSLDTLYFADQTRTFFKGEPSADLKAMYAEVLAAQEWAIRQVKDGVDGKNIYDGVLNFFTAHGYSTDMQAKPAFGFIHGVGHGVGIDIHEPPRINRQPDRLRAGNVVTVEPGLYYPLGTAIGHIPVGGIRIEDMVLVTENGCRNLTRFPKDLDSMIID